MAQPPPPRIEGPQTPITTSTDDGKVSAARPKDRAVRAADGDRNWSDPKSAHAPGHAGGKIDRAPRAEKKERAEKRVLITTSERTRSVGISARSGKGGAVAGATYAHAVLPELAGHDKAPGRPGLARRIFEWLFGWFPGVSTDGDKLKAYARKLADEHGSDLEAFKNLYADELRDRRKATSMPDGPHDDAGDTRDAMIDQLTTKIMKENHLSEGTARGRATTVVDVMMKRHEANIAKDKKNVAALNIPEKKDTREAESLAKTYFPAKRRAEKLGGDWPKRLDAALTAKIDNAHAVVASQPLDKQERMKISMREERVNSVAYLMALEQGGQLKNVPPKVIDALLGAQRAGLLTGTAVAEAASALENMPKAERDRALKAFDSVPADRRDVLMAVFAREHLAMSSSDPTERAASLLRVEQAASELTKMNATDALNAFNKGTLGLDKTSVDLKVKVGGKEETIKLPVFFHPAIPAKDRQKHLDLVREAYQMIPPALLKHMMKGEGNTAGEYNVQFYTRATLQTGTWGQERPEGRGHTQGYYNTDDDEIRIDATALDRVIEGAPGGVGRAEALRIILHESSHFIDDLSDAAARDGFFIGIDFDRQMNRTDKGGELEGAWSHLLAVGSRYKALQADDPKFLKAEMLGLKNPLSAKDEAKVTELHNDVAGRAGAVSPYAANGGIEGRGAGPGNQIGEWFAESYAAFLNPATRDRLKQIDPVMFAAAEKFTKLVEGGAKPTDAMRETLRFSLATDVAARQGKDMLAAAKKDASLDTAKLGDLESIASAFELHAKAIDGWTAFDGDKELTKFRADEAKAGVAQGRELLTAIGERKAALEARGDKSADEYKRLSSVEKRLGVAVDQLEKNARAITVAISP